MKRNLIAMAGVLSLGACAAVPPSGPSVVSLPPNGKSLQAFQGDDFACRDYAQSRIPNANVAAGAATQNSVGSTVVGTALGAGAGAALGALGGNVGAGAAIGGVTGALIGGSAGADQSNATSAGLQQRYDVAYAQCMASKGNTVENPARSVAVVEPYPDPYYGAPFYGPAFGFGFGYGGGYYHHYRRW